MGFVLRYCTSSLLVTTCCAGAQTRSSISVMSNPTTLYSLELPTYSLLTLVPLHRWSQIHVLLSSLISRLCAKLDFFCDILSSLYSQHYAGSQLPDDDLLTQCLEDMLKLPGLPPIYESPNSSGVPSPHELVLKLVTFG